MYTQCPACQTLFRISSQQLKAADGDVRCGQCHQVFNALNHLCEAPAPKPQPVATPPSGKDREQADLDAFFDAPPDATTPSAGVAVPPATDDFFSNSEPDPLSVPHDADMDLGTEPLWRLENTDLITETDAGAVYSEAAREPGDLATWIPADSAAGGTLPQVLSNNLPGPIRYAYFPSAAPPRASPWWMTGVIALTLVFMGQYAYFERNQLAATPSLRPWVEEFCLYARCQLPMRHDLQQIEFLERDIYSHPATPDTLVIKAVLVNGAPFFQPYPDLQIAFSNLMGQTVAMRRFHPHEYLPQGLDPSGGMTPDVPLRVQLQIQDPGEDALNFEFSLLDHPG